MWIVRISANPCFASAVSGLRCCVPWTLLQPPETWALRCGVLILGRASYRDCLLKFVQQYEEVGVEFDAAVKEVCAGKPCLLEPFDLACGWTLAFVKSTTCPDICAHMRELVSCLLTADWWSCILDIRHFGVSPTL